ncbi:hypothetical protein QFC21_001603 [Naganishia friedmannii]|uniref:Uncharacterized protein n=1 Tax=Naganishia friedmannii TaxID=89922 RepID=A0ACC2W1D1_9TREE|nr:hypothetical protein QFC21_001603 [Naganishia friedmannii]
MSARPQPKSGVPASVVQGTSSAAPSHPLRQDFSTDPRVHFDQTAGKWQYEDDVTGQDFEWNEPGQAWMPVISDDLIRAQQAAYSVEGVDENAEIVSQRYLATQRKRKQAEIDYTSNDPVISSSTSAVPHADAQPDASAPSKETNRPPKVVKPRPVTDVYVSNLPQRTTVDLLARIFGRAGLLMTDDEGNPKIKLYSDDAGTFKGDALISYFKGESVDLAVTLFDDTELEMGSGEGNIHVSKAEYKQKSKREDEDQQKKPQGETKTATNAVTGAAKPTGKKGKKPTKERTEEQKRAAKRIRSLQSKLEDWSSGSDNEDPAAPLGGAPKPGNNRMNRVVVLKQMFTLQELEEDPGLALELKDDVREEAETIGTVTNIHLFDKEEDGVMTIKFKDAISAQACLLKMNGRFFGGRQIQASLYDGREQFKASGRTDEYADPDERDAEESKRLDRFAAWLVDERGEDGEDTPA